VGYGLVVERHLESGARCRRPGDALGFVLPITERGDSGFVTAAVVDPFGNILGVMHNPHYLEILRAKEQG
jgi:hypothetical protein